MSEFALLYRSTQEAHREAMGSPEKAQQSMTKWRAWFKEMADQGQLKSIGQPLERVGSVVAGKKRTVTDATPGAGRQRRGREEEDGHRRSLRRDEGRDRRLLPHRGEGSRAGGGEPRRMPDPGVRGIGGGAPGPAARHLMDVPEHLFRREAGRLVSILTRLFGLHNLALAEDVVQDAFCRALETWKFHGVPANPSAWLMKTAKHRALDILRREGTARRCAPELERELDSEWTLAPAVDEAFAAGLDDAQLRMMFSCIHPRLPEETQVALVLHLLCGFGIDETAAAFLKGRAAMEKRIARAKKTLAASKRLFDLGGPAEVAARLPAVLRALYLLFNEGYHCASPQAAVRAELCEEALRLVYLLLEHRLTSTPAAHALAALMNLHAARLPGRLDAHGNLLVLVDQDRSRWDAARIAEGLRRLELSAAGAELT